jgi:hypothetical protein
MHRSDHNVFGTLSTIINSLLFKGC